MPIIAEVDEAIDQIINEMVVQDENGRQPVSINLDMIDDEVLDEQMKARIAAEYDGLLKLMHFQKDAYSVVRQWYVDGRLYYHLVVDEEKPDNGILELRIVDPRTIRKVREVQRKRHEETQMDILEVQREYFVYNPMGFVAPTNITGSTIPTSAMLQYNGVRITLDSIAFLPSGLYDSTKRTVLSWLHKAIKPLNLFRMMEDSCVIYRVARAPERRVFYIDVGNMPKNKAEQYLYDIMQRYRNKIVYDVQSGDMRDDRKFMSIMEDFWLPRREGGKGTEITTLPAGQNLSEMEDVDYFRRKLYRALNLPPSRIDPGQGFNLGRASEISRDELRFYKFIHRLQTQFNGLFDQLLEKQLRLKGVVTEKEWEKIKDNIRYEWQHDSYFEELKGQEIWSARLNLLTQMEPYLNKFFSNKWIQQNVLHFTDDEMAQIRDDFDEVSIPGEDAEGLSGEDEEEKKNNPFGDEAEEGEDKDEMDPDAPFDKDGEDSPFGADEEDKDDEKDELSFGDDDEDELLGKDKKKPEASDKKSAKSSAKGKTPAKKKKKPAVKKKAESEKDISAKDDNPAKKSSKDDAESSFDKEADSLLGKEPKEPEEPEDTPEPVTFSPEDEKVDDDGVVWVKKSAVVGDDEEEEDDEESANPLIDKKKE